MTKKKAKKKAKKPGTFADGYNKTLRGIQDFSFDTITDLQNADKEDLLKRRSLQSRFQRDAMKAYSLELQSNKNAQFIPGTPDKDDDDSPGLGTR